jgi:D-alanyl-D-alanine carboxypeptidase
LLANYRGADGIKTGYTRAAGFNLVASAERGNERVIATVFGGKSTTSRNARVAELLNMGFRRAPSRAPVRKPRAPAYVGNTDKAPVKPGAAGKTIRVSGAVKKSLRPQMRPGATAPVLVAQAKPAPKQQQDVVTKTDITAALVAAEVASKPIDTTLAVAEAVKAEDPTLTTSVRPTLRPRALLAARPAKQVPTQEVVTRASTSGGRHWGVNVGRYPSRFKAQKVLLQTALTEMTTLDGSLRKVVRHPRGFDANFLGMDRKTAELACRRLQARNIDCTTFGPG